jgi:hypothetical protein
MGPEMRSHSERVKRQIRLHRNKSDIDPRLELSQALVCAAVVEEHDVVEAHHLIEGDPFGEEPFFVQKHRTQDGLHVSVLLFYLLVSLIAIWKIQIERGLHLSFGKWHLD